MTVINSLLVLLGGVAIVAGCYWLHPGLLVLAGGAGLIAGIDGVLAGGEDHEQHEGQGGNGERQPHAFVIGGDGLALDAVALPEEHAPDQDGRPEQVDPHVETAPHALQRRPLVVVGADLKTQRRIRHQEDGQAGSEQQIDYQKEEIQGWLKK